MNIFKIIFELCFPEKCISCGSEGEIICDKCKSFIETLKTFECSACFKSTKFGEFCCDKCSKEFFFDYLLVSTRYSRSPLIKELIKRFKYRNKKGLTLFFGEILNKRFEEFLLVRPDLKNIVVSPVPMDRKKEKERGYNQSELLSKNLAKHFRLTHLSPLKWIKYAGQQAGKSRQERIMSRAFSMGVVKGFQDKIFGKDFLLVDDVAATMSTVNECSRVLRENGAKSIGVIVISRK
ncbi:MAG: hypothetical protein RBS56_04555 [Candidatus Gracilibacteria bacterium]|jgi:ComF family protein|nr:hypothetical protein [Candidatus Gracilibacteria bacterium]